MCKITAPALGQQADFGVGSCRRGLLVGPLRLCSPKALIDGSGGRKQHPSSPSDPSESCFCQLCLQQFSVCSHLSPRTQMIVLDQVHKLSSLGRLFIIMYRVYKPLPATVGQHRVRPGAQHPPHPSCEHSTELDQQQAHSSSSVTLSGGKGTARDRGHSGLCPRPAVTI